LNVQQTASAQIALGRFTLDLRTRALLDGPDAVPLGSRAFETLAVLASAPGRLFGKDELLDRVWPGLSVEENNLQVQIATTLSAIQAVQSQLAVVAQKTDATATRLDQVEKKVETLALSYTAFEAKGEVTNKLLRWVGGLAALAIVSFIGFGYSLARHAGSLDEKVQHHQDTLNDIKAKLK